MDNKLKKVLATIIAASMLTASMAMPALASSGVTIDGVNKAGNKITGVKVIKGDGTTANGKAVVALYDAQNNMKGVAISAEDLNSATDGVLDLDANGLEFADGDIVKTFLWEVDANGSITAKPITGIYSGTATVDPVVETYTVSGTITAGVISVSLVNSEDATKTFAGTIADGSISFADVVAGTYSVNVGYADGYEADKIMLGDAEVTNIDVTGNITNLAISAKEAAPTAYAITNGTTDTNGTVELSAAEAIAGTEITVTATPSEGYKVNAITVNGKAITGTTFTMPAEAVTVVVTFISENIKDDVLPTSYDADSMVTIASNATQTEVEGDRTVTSLAASAENTETFIINVGLSAGLKDATAKTINFAYDMKLEAGDVLITRPTKSTPTDSQGPTTYFYVNDAGNIVYDHQTSSSSGYGTAKTDTGLVAADSWYRVVMSGTRATTGYVGSYDLNIYAIDAEGKISAEPVYTVTGLGARNNASNPVNNFHIGALNGSPVIDCAYIYTAPYYAASVNVAVEGAAVTVTGNGNTYTGTTTADGTFAIPAIQAGTYTVNVKAAGYKDVEGATLTVAADGTNTLSITLEAQTAAPATVTIKYVDEEGVSLADDKVLTTDLWTGDAFEITTADYNTVITKTNATDNTKVDVYKYKSGAENIEVMEATNTITIVYENKGVYNIYEDFTNVTDTWGFANGQKGSVVVSNGALGLTQYNKSGYSDTKTFDATISSAKKVNVSFDWKSNIQSGKNRKHSFDVTDSSGNVIFSIYASATDGVFYKAGAVAGTDGGAAEGSTKLRGAWPTGDTSGWYNVDLTYRNVNDKGYVTGTITAEDGTVVTIDETAVAATNFAIFKANDLYSLVPQFIDNVAIKTMELTDDDYSVSSSATIVAGDDVAAEYKPYGGSVAIKDLGDFTVADGKVTGTANYIESWPQFSGDVALQSGYYTALAIQAQEGAIVTITKGDETKTQTADADGVMSIVRLGDGDTITYTVDNDGEGTAYKAKTYTIDLSGIAYAQRLTKADVVAAQTVAPEYKPYGGDVAVKDFGDYTITADGTKLTVEGTANYKTWTAYSTDPATQEGHYIPLAITAPEGAIVTITSGEETKTFTAAGEGVMAVRRITDSKATPVTITVDTDGDAEVFAPVTYTLDMSAVELGKLDSDVTVTDAVTAAGAEYAVFGKAISEFGTVTATQNGTEITLSGSSNYVEGYTGFNETDAAEQEGNYIALAIATGVATDVTVNYNDTEKVVAADEQGLISIIRLVDGKNTITYTVDFDDDGIKYAPVTYTVDASAVVKQTKSYAITKDTVENGTVEVAESARVGETVTVTATPTGTATLKNVYYIVGETKTVIEAVEGVYSFTMPAGAVTVGAEFSAAALFDASVTTPENGTVTLSTYKAEANEEVEITYTADEHYELDAITVMNGETPVEVTEGKFTMPEGNVTVTVTFKKKTYTVTFDVNGNQTTADVTALGTVAELPEVVAPSGKHLAGWSINGGETVDAATVLATEITGATTITAVFEDTLYTITTSDVENGTVAVTVNEAEATTAKLGDVVTIKATPAEGYEIDSIAVNDGAVEVTDGKFTMPEGDVTITVTFKAVKYAITANSAVGGTYTVTDAEGNEVTEATAGTVLTITATPEAESGLVAGKATVNDVAIARTAAGVYTYTMANEAIEIDVEFVNYYEDYTLTADAGWSIAQADRYTANIKADGTNKYLALEPAGQNNGTNCTSPAIGYTGTSFKMEFDLALTKANNQASSFVVRDAGGANLFNVAQSANASDEWVVNGSAEKYPLGGGVWNHYVVEYYDGNTYLTVTKVADGSSVIARTKIATTSTAGGVGTLYYATARYWANAAIDNIEIKSVDAATVAKYDVSGTSNGNLASVTLTDTKNAANVINAAIDAETGAITAEGLVDGTYTIAATAAAGYVIDTIKVNEVDATAITVNGGNVEGLSVTTKLADPATVTINYVDAEGNVLAEAKTITENVYIGQPFTVAGNYDVVIKKPNETDALKTDVYEYTSGANDIAEMAATNEINVVYTKAGSFNLYEDFSAVADTWGFSKGASNSVVVSNGALGLTQYNKTGYSDVKLMDADIANAKKLKVSFDYRNTAESGKGRDSNLELRDGSDNIIFSIYGRGNSGTHADVAATAGQSTTKLGGIGAWYTVDLDINFTAGTVSGTVKDAGGTTVATYTDVAITATSFNKIVATDLYSAAPQFIDNVAIEVVEYATKYNVTVGAVENGEVTVDKASAYEGETVTVTATPADGYELTAILVNGEAIDGNTFTMGAAVAEVTATFVEAVVEETPEDEPVVE